MYDEKEFQRELILKSFSEELHSTHSPKKVFEYNQFRSNGFSYEDGNDI